MGETKVLYTLYLKVVVKFGKRLAQSPRIIRCFLEVSNIHERRKLLLR